MQFEFVRLCVLVFLSFAAECVQCAGKYISQTPAQLICSEVERCHGYVTLIVIIIESFKNLWPTFRLFSISNRKMRIATAEEKLARHANNYFLALANKKQFQLAFTMRIFVLYALGKIKRVF